MRGFDSLRVSKVPQLCFFCAVRVHDDRDERVEICIGCPAISKETATRETAVQIEPRRVILMECCSNGAQEYELYIGLMNWTTGEDLGRLEVRGAVKLWLN